MKAQAVSLSLARKRRVVRCGLAARKDHQHSPDKARLESVPQLGEKRVVYDSRVHGGEGMRLWEGTGQAWLAIRVDWGAHGGLRAVEGHASQWS